MSWVPVGGAAGGAISINPNAAFVVVGGFSAGDIIRRVRVSFAGNLTSVLRFGAVMTGTRAADADAFAAGASLFGPTGLASAGQPAIDFSVAADSTESIEFYPGFGITSSARFLLARILCNTATAAIQALVAAEVVRVREGGGGSSG